MYLVTIYPKTLQNKVSQLLTEIKLQYAAYDRHKALKTYISRIN